MTDKQKYRWWLMALLGLIAVLAAAYLAWGRPQPVPQGDQFEGTTPREGVQLPIDSAEEMDRSHAERAAAFPAETQGRGLQPLEPRIEDGVKVFELTTSVIQWEVEPGIFREAWAYNEQVPGPEIRVVEGDRVRVIVHNELPESTSVHWHGQYMRGANEFDGVAFVTQDPIKPGDSFTYEFTAEPAGSHMYHSHHNSTKQVARGLLGPLIVEPADPARRYDVDREYIIVLNDGPLGYTINGKSFPATEPIRAREGERILIRWMHEGALLHPMHVHGLLYEVVARDGHPLPHPFYADTLTVMPGERWDTIIEANNPGTWLLHCHVLPHAEGEHGLMGLSTMVIIEPMAGVDPPMPDGLDENRATNGT